jgi:hypothetical protein
MMNWMQGPEWLEEMRRRRQPWLQRWNNVPSLRMPQVFHAPWAANAKYAGWNTRSDPVGERVGWIKDGTDPYRNSDMSWRNPDRSPTYGLTRNGPEGMMYQQTKDMYNPDPTINIGGSQMGSNMNNYMAQNTKPLLDQGLPDIFGSQNPWAKLGWKI